MTYRTWPLVHPPLLGPAVLQPPATELRRRGSGVAVPVPDLWPDDVRYVHPSAAHAAEATAARERGWTVIGDGTGAHPDVADDPCRVADLLG